VCDFVDQKVFTYGSPGSFPHDRRLGGMESDQQGPVTHRGPEQGVIGDGPLEPGRCRVDFRGGADHTQSSNSLSMLVQERQWGYAGLDGKDGNHGGGKEVGNLSLNPVP